MAMQTEGQGEMTVDPGATVVSQVDTGEAKERRHFDIQVYRDWCKGCGICAALCPKQVLGRNDEGGPVVLDPDACIGCGWCELHCPDFAISVLPRSGQAEPGPAAGGKGEK
jgi:2-oxoglutarate ferredoxin oxidoreductase subunit delta